MNYDTFIDQVARRAHVASAQAVDLTRGALATLAERLTGGEALDLAAQLPQPLQSVVRPLPAAEAADRFDAAEFVRRVAARAGVDDQQARDGVRAVFTTVREAVTGGEFDDLMAQLPRDYREMVEPALAPGATRRHG
ncbi:DUF2267 domain-containing protein [Micromonospora echinofusca]|uniref:DUF2267 domain-containing protein n=1 Tax=Micromonospora echinofusca TaxID=47858 RepID=A0ABS3VVJ3_MICEH|nr:DUF2267 domain-containing protein [Micromonospora echinofusca]MBO4208567.1 DUF2267 domain-containing protein [Micromonospora echinofusca]